MIMAKYFQRLKSSILGCKFHLYLRKFSMFMIISPKILNLHDSMLYRHLENNKDDTSTTGLIPPSQPFLGPLLILHLEDMFVNDVLSTTSTLIVGAHFLKSLQDAPVVFKCGKEFPKNIGKAIPQG